MQLSVRSGSHIDKEFLPFLSARLLARERRQLGEQIYQSTSLPYGFELLGLKKEMFKTWSFQVPIHDQNFLTPISKQSGDVGQGHGPANTALKRVERYYRAHIQ